MLTTLSIISLDQGKLWKDPGPFPRENAAAIETDGASVAPEGPQSFSALLALLLRLTNLRSGQKQA